MTGIDRADAIRAAHKAIQKIDGPTTIGGLDAAAAAADAILALVQPAAGINLTPEEADLASSWFRYIGLIGGPLDDTDQKLHERLEASA